MAQWRKVVVSGSTVELNHISASGDIVPITADGGTLGSQYFEWSDVYLADSGVFYLGNDQDVTMTHVPDTGIILNSDNSFQFRDSALAINSSTDGQMDIIADSELEITAPTVALNSDSQVLAFGADDDVTLTHIPDIALRFNSAMGLQFRDASLAISSSADGQLDISADSTIQLDAPTIEWDKNDSENHFSGSAVSSGSFGWLKVHGDAVIGGNLTLGDATTDFVTFAADISSSLIPDGNDSYNLGSSGQRWNDLYISGSIDATGGTHNFSTNVDSATAFTVTTNKGTSEQIKLTNTQGTTDGTDGAGSILLDATAGGMSLAWADDKDLWAEGGQVMMVANHNTTDAIKLHADAGGSQTITVVNDEGTSEAAIGITSTAGGVDIDASAGKNIDISGGQVLVSSKTDEANAIRLLTDIGTSETIVITNTQGTDAAAIDINATAGGIDIDAGGAIDIDTSAAITIGGTNATGVTVGKSNTTVTIPGSLDVNGTLTTIDTDNLRVKDRFIIVASGSTTGDGGIIANTHAGGSGSAFYYDDSNSRWALTKADDTAGSATSATPRQFLVSVSQSAAPPDLYGTQNPSDFGTDAASRRGMIYVQTSADDSTRTVAGDIWIWS
ncbi:MAG: hypothetical protein H8E03_00745 [Pelagibacteraceae bacterium]|nr:hypothetical protein [Pelagibacteraceae bacterium]